MDIDKRINLVLSRVEDAAKEKAKGLLKDKKMMGFGPEAVTILIDSVAYTIAGIAYFGDLGED